MSTPDELLAQLLATAREQLRWHRAAVLPEVRKTIESALSTTQLRQAYEMCDGKKSGTEIATEVGTSQQTVSRWTRRWRDIGIVYESDDSRIKHITSLKSLGLPLEVDGDESTSDGQGRTRAKRSS